MQYRSFGTLDWKASSLGFGCMRLPTSDQSPFSGNVLEEDSIQMIRYAIANGVNYVDTAYVYHAGKSEVVLGKALAHGLRDKVKIATKSPVILVKTADDFDKFLDEQLKRLDVNKIDFYLFHALTQISWEKVKSLKLLSRAEKALHEGKIGHIGFSFHDNYESFENIIDGYDGWSMCQIQYNFMDTNNQAGTKGLKLAAAKGIGVVVMEPLLGGKLANPPAEIKKHLADSGYTGSVIDLAFQWLYDQPEISLVLSGMSTLDQVANNVESANNSGIGALTQEDKRLIAYMQRVYNEKASIPCTNCGYCMPCPNGVNIPANFKLCNDAVMYDSFASVKRMVDFFLKPEQKADKCIQCKVCIEKCPQGIQIDDWLQKVHEMFG